MPQWRVQVRPIGTVTERSEWVRALPKIEIHLHLEGAMRPDTVPHLSLERLGSSGPLETGWEQEYYTFTDFAGFMAQLTPRFPGTPAEYARLARECFEDLVAQHVVYAEISFDFPVRAVDDDRRFGPILDALEQARREAEAVWPIRLNYIAGIQRNQPLEVALMRVRLAAEARERGMALVGIDLHGDEEQYTGAHLAPAFQLGRELGFGLRAHAGEARGPDSVWEAINDLEVRRIAHGTRSVEDPSLIDRLKVGDISLDMCPTSNVRTNAVPNLASHPFRRLYEQGIPVTVNSDDPLPFFTNLERECRLLVDEYHFTRQEMWDLMRTALRCSFMPADERQDIASIIDAAYSSPQPLTGAVG
jgi:adenosine deaminase